MEVFFKTGSCQYFLFSDMVKKKFERWYESSKKLMILFLQNLLNTESKKKNMAQILIKLKMIYFELKTHHSNSINVEYSFSRKNVVFCHLHPLKPQLQS